jgi:lysozyme family protein
MKEFHDNLHFERFLHVASIVLGFEGGFSDNPDDAGGKTNLGITERTLNAAYKKGITEHNDILKLTRKEALMIYFRMYWIPCHAYEIPDPLDFAMFDLAVNGGCGRAVMILQEAINDFLVQPIAVDGGFGPKTKAALDRICSTEITGFLPFASILSMVYLIERVEFYDQITDGEAPSPSRRKQEIKNRTFLRGWIRRTMTQKRKFRKG